MRILFVVLVRVVADAWVVYAGLDNYSHPYEFVGEWNTGNYILLLAADGAAQLHEVRNVEAGWDIIHDAAGASRVHKFSVRERSIRWGGSWTITRNLADLAHRQLCISSYMSWCVPVTFSSDGSTLYWGFDRLVRQRPPSCPAIMLGEQPTPSPEPRSAGLRHHPKGLHDVP